MLPIKRFFLLVFFLCIPLLLSNTTLAADVKVNALVPANQSDLDFDFRRVTDGNIFHQNKEIEFEIAYGLNTAGSLPFTITASWSQGFFESGSDAPTMDVVEYVPGSAQKAYDNTEAIVDTINRTITWNITNLPGNTTDQKVTFKLKTNEAYTNPNYKARFDVTASTSSSETLLPSRTISQYYQHGFNFIPTPTPTPTSTPPPPTPPDLEYVYVTIPSITTETVKVELRTSVDTEAELFYGTDPDNLSEQLSSRGPRIYHFFTLEELNPETVYYFRARITDSFRPERTLDSNIYTFTTAEAGSVAPKINIDTIVFTGNNNIIFSKLDPTFDLNTLVIPNGGDFEFKFSLSDTVAVKSVHGLVKDSLLSSDVLGITSDKSLPASSNYALITETVPGVFVGRLKAPEKSGLYGFYVRIADNQGNIVEQKVSDIRTIPPFKITDGEGDPVENAMVTFWIYNPKTKIYSKISPEIFPIQNPAYSNSNGIIDIILPQGSYRAEISSIRHGDATVDFQIGPEQGQQFPPVQLETKPLTPLLLFSYFSEIIRDVTTTVSEAVDRFSSSNRFFDLIALTSLALFALIALTALLSRLHLHPTSLSTHLGYHMKILTGKSKSNYIVGHVVDEKSDKSVMRALVYLIDKDKNDIIGKTYTNRAGEFILIKGRAKSVKLSVFKENYETPKPLEYKVDSSKPIQIPLYPIKGQTRLLPEVFHHYFGMLFEILTAIVLYFEIVFTQSLGIAKTGPLLFITISSILFYVWMYLHWRRKRRNIYVTS